MASRVRYQTSRAAKKSPSLASSTSAWRGVLTDKTDPGGIIRALNHGIIEDVNANRGDGTVLHDACLWGNRGATQMLLDARANMEAQDGHGNTPLHIACKHGQLSVAQLLLESGAVLNSRNTPEETPLHLACQYGNLDVAQLLLKNGADVNAVSEIGETPLHVACQLDHLEVSQLLISAGANRSVTDLCGQTPLDVCSPEHRSMLEPAPKRAD